MLNRAALIVTPAQPYIDWASSLDDSGLSPVSGESDARTIYLIPEYDDEGEIDEILERVFAEVFERELEAWHTHEPDWPQNRTLAMFKRWFKIEIHSMIEDLCADPLIDDES